MKNKVIPGPSGHMYPHDVTPTPVESVSECNVGTACSASLGAAEGGVGSDSPTASTKPLPLGNADPSAKE